MNLTNSIAFLFCLPFLKKLVPLFFCVFTGSHGQRSRRSVTTLSFRSDFNLTDVWEGGKDSRSEEKKLTGNCSFWVLVDCGTIPAGAEMTKLEDDRLLSVKWLSLFQGLKTGTASDSVYNISTRWALYFTTGLFITYYLLLNELRQ